MAEHKTYRRLGGLRPIKPGETLVDVISDAVYDGQEFNKVGGFYLDEVVALIETKLLGIDTKGMTEAQEKDLYAMLEAIATRAIDMGIAIGRRDQAEAEDARTADEQAYRRDCL